MSKLSSEECEIISTLIKKFIDCPDDKEVLSSVAVYIDAGMGAQIFNMLLNKGLDAEKRKEIQIVKTMSFLEKLMDISPVIAGYLMGRLYPMAGKMHLHEVCDAIELWMHANKDENLAGSLMKLANEGVRPLLQKRYIAWATRIRENTK